MRHLPNIQFKIIPAKEQRYDTCGDYFPTKEGYQFRVSKWNSDYEFLVLMHELTEWYLTQKRGIPEKSISKFDIWFNEQGLEGEPGDHKDAPYKKEHHFAEKIEKMLAKELGINWKKYEEEGFEY
ncbi:MAG: hypothetical protein WCO07_01360 [bacterium]